MELETLKSMWKEQDPSPELETDLSALLQKKSRGPIARMRRNLRIEGLLIVITYIPTIIAYLSMFDGELRISSLIMSVVFIFFWVYYYRKNQLLKKMQCVSCEVRSNLAGQVKTLRKYVRFYVWSGTIIIIMAIILDYLVVTYSLRLRHPSWKLHQWWLEPAFLLALMAPVSVGLYFMNKWYVNKLYGRHVEKLQQLLREMDEG